MDRSGTLPGLGKGARWRRGGSRARHAFAVIGFALLSALAAPCGQAAQESSLQSGQASGQESGQQSAVSIGHVKTVVGDAWVSVPGSVVPAQVGTPLYVGATLKTGPGASLGVTLNDDTVISIGPDSEVSVDEFAFNPTGGDLKLGANMVRGTLNFISGWIAKLRPEAQTVRTPTGMIGVRGTHFLVKVAPPNP